MRSFRWAGRLQRAPLGIVAAGVCYAYLNDLLHSLGWPTDCRF